MTSSKIEHKVRAIAITKAILEGATLDGAGLPHKITRERVRQIFIKQILILMHPMVSDHGRIDGEHPPEYDQTSTKELREGKEYWLKLLKVYEHQLHNPPMPVPTAGNLHTPIANLPVTVRTINCLRSEGIETIADLVKFSPRKLLSIPNFGAKSIRELAEVLREYGVSLPTKDMVMLSDSVTALDYGGYGHEIVEKLNRAGIYNVGELIDKTQAELETLLTEQSMCPDWMMRQYVQDILTALSYTTHALK